MMEKLSRARSGEAWTDEEKDQLARLFDEGQSIQEICAAHERSGNSIITMLRRMDRVRTEGNAYVRTGPAFVTFKELKTL